MTSTVSHKPMRVLPGGTARSYIIVPLSQLPDLQRILDELGVGYEVDANAISLGGKPEVTFVNLNHGTDSAEVQKALDRHP
jgi:hypothetical protein